MKYKTKRQAGLGPAIFFLIVSLCGALGMILEKLDGNPYYPSYAGLIIGLLGVLVFLYYSTYDVKRKWYQKKGECLKGYIVGADMELCARGENTYFLKISFFDNGKKIKYTEGYSGNPNEKLKSCECKIYKWKDKYIEGDLIMLDKKQKPMNLNIPIQKYHRREKKKGYV